MPEVPGEWRQTLLERHGLPPSYLEHAQKWFAPMAHSLAEHQKSAGRPVLVAVNGSQGSGKTTLCDYLCGELLGEHGLVAVALSLDDFYHTRAAREQLCREIHPLLLTRGVPGTHDTALMQCTLDGLLAAREVGIVPVPRFDKAVDDRRPPPEWDQVSTRIDIVLLEGWCLGARAQPEEELPAPLNALERLEDPDGTWRRHVNRALAVEFEPLYRRVDQWVMLRAPCFECVYRWRLEQERKLAARVANGKGKRLMGDRELARFVQHFQRLTIRCLETLPPRVHHLYHLDSARNIAGYRYLGEPEQ